MDERKLEDTRGDSSAGRGAGAHESKLSEAHRLHSELERQNRNVAQRLDQAEQNVRQLDEQLEAGAAGQPEQQGRDSGPEPEVRGHRGHTKEREQHRGMDISL